MLLDKRRLVSATGVADVRLYASGDSGREGLLMRATTPEGRDE